MKKLPIGIHAFDKLIKEDYLYVDKTEHIYQLITRSPYYFIARPRRFGKSLLVSTLKELFLGNKELFEHLWIGKQSNYGWPQHPVVYLNLSDLDCHTPSSLKADLSWGVESIAREYGIDVSAPPSAGLKLKELVKELAKRNSVVILIDESDFNQSS
jgi:hypothetical protein